MCMTDGDCDSTSRNRDVFSFPPGTRTWLGGHDLTARREVHNRLKATIELVSGSIDVAIITPLSTDEAVYFAQKVAGRLQDQGPIWISRPRSTKTPARASSNPTAEFIRTMHDVGFKEIDRYTLSSTCSLHKFQFSSSASWNPL